MNLKVIGPYGPYAPTGKACSGYLLSDGRTNILLDAGPGVMARLPARGLRVIDAVILSHLHWDHCSDALAMRYALQFQGISMPLYLPDEPDDVFAHFTGWGGAEPNVIGEGREYAIGTMKLRFFPMRHPVKAYGVRVESGGKVFAYTGDTNTTEALDPLLANADMALIDACFTGAQWKAELPHLSARLAAQAALRANVKKALLTHLNPATDAALLLEQAAEIFDRCEIAQAGKTYDIND